MAGLTVTAAVDGLANGHDAGFIRPVIVLFVLGTGAVWAYTALARLVRSAAADTARMPRGSELVG